MAKKTKKVSKDALLLENFLIPARALETKEGPLVPSFLSMDIALSGGIPVGSNVLISGKPKSGKTTISLHFAAKYQAVNPDATVYFFDVEGRLQTALLKCIKGLDLDRFQIIRSNMDRLLSAEDYFNLILRTMKDYPGCLVILDSIAALCPEASLTSSIGDSVKRAGVASLMYDVFKITSQLLPVTMSTFIGLTHLTANPGALPFQKQTVSSGGNAKDYGASTWLEIPFKKDITDSNNEVIGQEANVKVYAAARGAPRKDFIAPIIYGKGIDTNADLVKVALEYGFIMKGGSWFSLPTNKDIEGILPESEDQEEIKIQGEGNVSKYLDENPEYAEKLETYIRNIALP